MNRHVTPLRGERLRGIASTRRLCPLIMLGDPDLATTEALLQGCVDLGIGMVELCVPFPNAFTDGEVLRRAHARALAANAGLPEALALIANFASRIDIVLLADASHTLRPHGFANVCRIAAAAGAAAILPHGLAPRMAADFAAAAAGVIPEVGTLYAAAAPETQAQIIRRAVAFIYLVSAYGRSGQAAPPGDITTAIAAIKAQTDMPVALGFGLKTPADVAGAFAAGADIAIVGSAISAAVEAGIGTPETLAPVMRLLAALQMETTT